jgi:hypothetical protein
MWEQVALQACIAGRQDLLQLRWVWIKKIIIELCASGGNIYQLLIWSIGLLTKIFCISSLRRDMHPEQVNKKEDNIRYKTQLTVLNNV